MNCEVYQRIGSPEMFTDGTQFSGVVNESVKLLGYIAADLHIARIDVTAKIYVVRDLNKVVVLERDYLVN